jgi:endonuclease VIII
VPEGDTVWLASRRLHDALAGHVLTTFDLRVPRFATVDLTGRSVAEVVPRGKHILTRVEGGVTLHTHLRMDGSWRITRPGARWSGGPAHQVRAVLANDSWVAVGYRLHDLALLPTRDEHRLVGHLGPDLLGPDWDPDEAVRRLLARPDRAVGEALLDQSNLAGVGNIYKAETLFLCGVSPWTPVGRVDDLRALVDTAHRLLFANRDEPARSTTGSRRRGEAHWVFDRPGLPCRRCRTTIRVADRGAAAQARLTYWCPRCQPGPHPEPGRRARR